MSTPTNEQRAEALRERLAILESEPLGNRDYFAVAFAADVRWLLSRIEELAKDKARLDWLETASFVTQWNDDPSLPPGAPKWSAATNDEHSASGIEADGATAREAIDAAMQAEAVAKFDAANPRPYRCGAFGTTTGSQCVLESDHDGEHQLETPSASSSGANTP